MRTRLVGLALACGLTAGPGSAQATGLASTGWCERSPTLSAGEQDTLLRFAGVLRAALDASGEDTVLISRSGLDLSDFGLRYSHAGVALRNPQTGQWQVRQLYYACDEQAPRLYDQGLAGFVMGSERPRLGFLSIVRLPPAAAQALRAAALDTPAALQLLTGRYSANAYAWSLRYQNCNQWVLELMARAWGALPAGPDLRERAQRWLRLAGYEPEPVRVPSHRLMFAASFVPLVHLDDHPEDDRFALRLKVSVPATLESFVRARWPDSQRLELCHDGRQAVTHSGWTWMDENCQPAASDTASPL